MFNNINPSLLFLATASAFLWLSCESSSTILGDPYLFVADDFSEVAVESAPKMSESSAHERFTVIVLNKDQTLPKASLQITGNYALEKGRIKFTPDETFKPGNTYRAIFQHNGKILERDFFVRTPNTSPTYVSQVYPSEPFLIQNIQRMYIEFSSPMSEGFAYGNVHFVNEYGDTARNVFSQNKERWNEDHTRLRLDLRPIPFIEGLAWHDSLNHRFRLFQKYRLVVENEMLDAKGRKLNNDFQKQYITYGAMLVRAGEFRVFKVPKAGSTDPVWLRARRPHDYESLLKSMELKRLNGTIIPGKVEIRDFETTWVFTPDEAWQTGEYQVHISDFIQDVAGNTRVTSMRNWKRNQELIFDKDSSAYFFPISFWPKEND